MEPMGSSCSGSQTQVPGAARSPSPNSQRPALKFALKFALKTERYESSSHIGENVPSP